MKAKEYVERFKAQGSTIEAAGKVAYHMFLESWSLMKSRGVRSNDGMVGVLNEMADKWKSFVRQAGPLCDGGNLDPRGFESVVRQRMPEIYQAWVLSPNYTG